jgi:hypothetical protein
VNSEADEPSETAESSETLALAVEASNSHVIPPGLLRESIRLWFLASS